MGLELVEIIMAVEQTFGIRLNEPDVPAIRTVGQLHDCIAKTLSQWPEPAELESRVCDKICRALETSRGLAAQSIQPEARLRELIPIAARRKTWRGVAKLLPERLSPLRRPKIVGWALAVVAVVLAWLCTFGPANPKWVTAEPALAMVCLFFIGPLAAFFGVVGYHLTRPLAVVWDGELETVGDLAQAAYRLNYGDLSGPRKHWSDEEIWNALREIIVEVLAVDPSAVTPESRLVEDLGAG